MDSKIKETKPEAISPKASSLSFLDQLQGKLKYGGLRPTSTKVTSADGCVTVLKNQGSVKCELEEGVKQVKSFGFVVDTKPDLTVGIVRPWLFLSSQDVPNDLNMIETHGITHILSLLPGFELIPQVKTLIRDHLILDVYDEVDFKLESPVLGKALEFMDNCHKSKGNNMLVHCNAGISRAPSTVILYLMKHEKLSFEQAWKDVKEARPFARPNEGFVKQMKIM